METVLDSVYQFLQSIGYPHPIHPTEVHMPIGLVVGALILSLVSAIFKREKPAEAARYAVILAFRWSFPTTTTGGYARSTYCEGDEGIGKLSFRIFAKCRWMKKWRPSMLAGGKRT